MRGCPVSRGDFITIFGVLIILCAIFVTNLWALPLSKVTSLLLGVTRCRLLITTTYFTFFILLDNLKLISILLQVRRVIITHRLSLSWGSLQICSFLRVFRRICPIIALLVACSWCSIGRMICGVFSWHNLHILMIKGQKLHIGWIVLEHGLRNGRQRICQFAQLVFSMRKTAIWLEFAGSKLREIPTNLRLVVAVDRAHVILTWKRLWHWLMKEIIKEQNVWLDYRVWNTKEGKYSLFGFLIPLEIRAHKPIFDQCCNFN